VTIPCGRVHVYPIWTTADQETEPIALTMSYGSYSATCRVRVRHGCRRSQAPLRLPGPPAIVPPGSHEEAHVAGPRSGAVPDELGGKVAALVRGGIGAWRRAVARDTWPLSAAVEGVEIGDPDLDAGRSNADGTANARRLHGVSRADADCLSHPHNSCSGVLGCVCHPSSTPDMPITRSNLPPSLPPKRHWTPDGSRSRARAKEPVREAMVEILPPD